MLNRIDLGTSITQRRMIHLILVSVYKSHSQVAPQSNENVKP